MQAGISLQRYSVAARGKFKLEIRIGDEQGKYVYCAPVAAPNRRLKPSVALVAGKQETHTEGVYYVRYTNHAGQRAYERIGKNATDAMNLKRRRELVKASTAAGLQVVDPEPSRTRLDDAIALDSRSDQQKQEKPE